MNITNNISAMYIRKYAQGWADLKRKEERKKLGKWIKVGGLLLLLELVLYVLLK
jgi:hypothetical protein